MSKIKRIFAENFMAHEKSEAIFDETGILNFCGKNASGKTAFTMIPEIIGYNAYEKEQSKYIRDNTKYYCIGIEFDDGITITQTRYRRTKSGNGKVLWKASKGDEILYQNMLGDAILLVEGVPDDSSFSIKKYMNMVIDESTGEELNVRRRNNKLMFIDTTGGENYKIFNSILGCEHIRKTSQFLSEKTNEYNSQLRLKKNEKETYKKAMEQIEILPQQILENLQKITSDTEFYTQKYEYAENLVNKMCEIKSIIVNPEFDKIDLDKFNKLEQMKKILSDIESININPEMFCIDTQKFSMLEDMKKISSKINEKIQPDVKIVDTKKLDMIIQLKKQADNITYQKQHISDEIIPVDVKKYILFGEIIKSFRDYKNSVERLKKVETEYNQIQAELKELAEKTGYKICQNCGAAVI